MMYKIARERRRDNATLWLFNAQYFVILLILLLIAAEIVLRLPWWIAVVMLAGTILITRVRVVSGDEAITKVTVLWLGFVPIKSREGVAVIRVGWNENHADGPADWAPDKDNEVTLSFRRAKAWRFPARRPDEIASWLRKAQADLTKQARPERGKE